MEKDSIKNQKGHSHNEDTFDCTSFNGLGEQWSTTPKDFLQVVKSLYRYFENFGEHRVGQKRINS